MDLKGKIALVTGGAAGIGKAYCEELLKHGAKVSVCDMNTETGEQLVQQLSGKYGKDRVIFCQCDVTDYPQYEESFQTTISVFGNLDIVINNAGIMNDRFWELEVDINLDSYHVNMTGVRVIAICPAATETGLIQDVKKQLLSSEVRNGMAA
ncbi:hypothetical protein C0J52_22502 [Blattella germanica]|nr:hypothetical protein C0J52_22502 [Blattella germanica]